MRPDPMLTVGTESPLMNTPCLFGFFPIRSYCCPPRWLAFRNIPFFTHIHSHRPTFRPPTLRIARIACNTFKWYFTPSSVIPSACAMSARVTDGVVLISSNTASAVSLKCLEVLFRVVWGQFGYPFIRMSVGGPRQSQFVESPINADADLTGKTSRREKPLPESIA